MKKAQARRQLRLRFCPPFVLAMLMFCPVASGQNASELNPKEKDSLNVILISEAVITGEIRETSVAEALRPVRVLGEEKINSQSGAVDVRDLLRNELNLRTTEDAVLGSGLQIQGLGGENVKILVDGVPVIGRMNGQIDLSQLPLCNVDQIELIEGPMSVEYGSNALAGTLNLITKQSKANSASVEADMRYESVGRYAQILRLDKGWGENSIMASFQRIYFDGWSPTDATFDWIEDFDADEGRVAQWNPKLLQQAEVSGALNLGNWLLRPGTRWLDETIFNRGLPRNPYQETAFDDTYRTRRIQPFVKFKAAGPNGLLNGVLSYNLYLRNKSTVLTDLTTLEETLLTDDGAVDTTQVELVNFRGTKSFEKNPNRTIKLGWDLQREQFTGPRINGNTKSISDLAGFATVRWNQDQSKHELGLRQAYNSKYDAPMLPSWNSVWTLNQSRLRASYARGFRAPSLKELHFRFVDINHELYGNPDLNAESSHNFQINWRRTKSSAIEINGFRNVVSNQIGFVAIEGATGFEYRNIGSFKSQGGRLRWSMQWDKVTLESGASWTWIWNDLPSNSGGSTWTRSPELSASGGWDLHPSLRLNTSLKWTGPSLRYYVDSSDQLMTSTMEGYTLWDATATFNSKNEIWRIDLGARNLMNIQDVNVTGPTGAHTSGSGILMSWGRSYFIRLNMRIASS